MKPFIPIIELHFSNRCTGNCVICSKAHGSYSFPYMTAETFEHVVRSLHSVDFNVIQVGGDGDSFLNPFFFDALRILRREFPGKPITLFTNGFMLTHHNSEVIIDEWLLDNIETRIDTVNPILFKQSTGLDYETVHSNLLYFQSINTKKPIRQHVIYFPLFLYRECVQTYLQKEPDHYKNVDESLMKNEYKDVYREFHVYVQDESRFNFRISEFCLWGERDTITPHNSLCSQLERAFKNQTYIYPNGNFGLCPFDDAQDRFILGNVFEDLLSDVWVSEYRLGIIQDIRDGRYTGRYPCADPRACDAYDFYRLKVNKYGV